MARVLCIWLVCAMARVALCADVPQGKVIWWGNDIHDPNTDKIFRDQTNGVFENDEEIVSNVIAIAGAFNHGLALRRDGTVITAGNFFRSIPVPPGLSSVESISMAGGFCWAMQRDGTVVQWRRIDSIYTTNVISNLRDVTSIASAGYQRFFGLKKDGAILSFPDPDFEAPTVDPTTGRTMREAAIQDVVIQGKAASTAAIGDDTAVILKRDGTVIQIREPFGNKEAVVVNGEVLSNVMAIAAGGTHCLALKSNGTVVAWGDNYDGVTDVPTGLSNVTSVAAAQNECLALRSDGTVVAWGNNYHGQSSVPSGLSNVVQIAAAGNFNMAITTGAVPASVFITPHGRLEEMARKADLIFKGQAISSERITNEAFTVRSMDVARTRFKVISVLQGDCTNEVVSFQHLGDWVGGWRGGSPPPNYKFEPGQSYIVIAANLARKEEYSFYRPAANTTDKPDEFREVADSSTQHDDGVIRTLDARPVQTGSLREAAWNEFNLLLKDPHPTNQLYAIRHLDWMSPLCNVQWGHSGDFKRPRVLQALRPFLFSTNEQVAIAAIYSFGVGHDCATQLVDYVPDLIRVVDNSTYSVARRFAAISAIIGNGASEITNALPRWLRDPCEHVRARAVLLLPDFPGEFSEAALRAQATDASPFVRARVADAIGNGKFEALVPTLVTLLEDPIGMTSQVPRLNDSELVPLGGDDANVHSAAGNALLKFNLRQVGGILNSNLNDAQFRPDFLCKLAEKDAGPWIPQLVEMMETWRSNRITEAKSNGFNPDMHLYDSTPYYQAWNFIYGYLTNLPPVEFSNSKMDCNLNVLEETGQGGGTEEPVKLYELYRTKGLNDRATNFRGEMEKKFATYAIADSFKQVDARLTNSAGR